MYHFCASYVKHVEVDDFILAHNEFIYLNKITMLVGNCG